MKHTLGIRNCNPLNIRKGSSRWLGLIPDDPPSSTSPLALSGERVPAGRERGSLFCRFSAMEYGFRAAFITLRTYMRSYNLNTIEKIIYRWAPPADGNDTEKYVRDVCRLTGLPGKAPMILNDPRLKEIVWAMAQIESGPEILAHREALEKGWELAFGS